MLLGEEFLQVALRLLDAPPAAEPPAVGEAMNMGVDREGRVAEGLGHHDARGLVPHAGQGLQFPKSPGHLAAVLLGDDLR